jgi:hypothetical protein
MRQREHCSVDGVLKQILGLPAVEEGSGGIWLRGG